MVSRLTRICTILTLVAFAGLASGANLSTPRQIVERKERECAQAIKAKNIGWYIRNTTSDYMASIRNQTLDKNAAIEAMQSLFAISKSFDTVTASIVSFKMEGKNVVVVTRTHLAGKIGGRHGRSMVMNKDETDREVWVPVGKDYKLRSARQVNDKLIVDGQPFNSLM
jgi:hypothetical protein